jgi:hypothetical protein
VGPQRRSAASERAALSGRVGRSMPVASNVLATLALYSIRFASCCEFTLADP